MTHIKFLIYFLFSIVFSLFLINILLLKARIMYLYDYIYF